MFQHDLSFCCFIRIELTGKLSLNKKKKSSLIDRNKLTENRKEKPLESNATLIRDTLTILTYIFWLLLITVFNN